MLALGATPLGHQIGSPVEMIVAACWVASGTGFPDESSGTTFAGTGVAAPEDVVSLDVVVVVVDEPVRLVVVVVVSVELVDPEALTDWMTMSVGAAWFEPPLPSGRGVGVATVSVGGGGVESSARTPEG